MTRSTRLAFNTTSMIDVIFILLVFFISISRLKEGRLALELPDAPGEKSPQQRKPSDALTVTIDADSRFSAGDRPCPAEPDLQAAVRAHRERHGPDAPVLFVADRASRSGALVAALKIVTDEGFKNLSFSYEPRGGGR